MKHVFLLIMVVFLCVPAQAGDVELFSDFMYWHGFERPLSAEIFETLPEEEQIIVLTILKAREDGQIEVMETLKAEYREILDSVSDTADFYDVLFPEPVSQDCLFRDGLDIRGATKREGEILPKALTEAEKKYDHFQFRLRGRVSRAVFSPTGNFFAPPAHAQADGVIFAWHSYHGSLLSELSGFVAEDYKVWMATHNPAYTRSVLARAGVNVGNVEFVRYTTDSIWVRDYGPRWIYETNGNRAIVDLEYYSQRPNDNAFPAAMARHMNIAHYSSGIKLEGGNLILDGHGGALMTSIILDFHSRQWVEHYMRRFFNVHKVTFVHPMHLEGTGHIDIFAKLIDENRIIVGEYASPAEGGRNYGILNENARILANTTNGRGEPFEVIRFPMPPHHGTEYFNTYINTLIVNQKVLVPIYGLNLDRQALELYRRLLPGYEVRGFDARELIVNFGAIHCITKLVMSKP